MLRLGIAGVGGMGQAHLRNYLKLKDLVEVVALADVLEDRRRGGKLGQAELNLETDSAAIGLGKIRSHRDYRDLCADPDLDVILVAMPSYMHADATVLALENGKNVLCEKPMALSVKDCQRMIDARNASGKKLMIAHVLRFWASYIQAREIITSGKYGKVISANFYRYGKRPGSSWYVQEQFSGGVPMDLHVHDVDAALFFWGKPDEISSGGRYVDSLPTFVHSRWDYKQGPTVLLESYWDSSTPFQAGFKIIFEKAALIWDMVGANELRLYVDKDKHITHGGRFVEALLAEDEYFLRCVEQNKPVDRCPPESSMQAVEIAIQTDRSIRRP